ncbi:MAG TPA: lysylphosphatidylglycerol synthase domain-containing protein [Methylomirabilota bacterium]|nr:lysylphosphatidylglycerol synthase domain-containing protein [Methylomirabilota bacterium]
MTPPGRREGRLTLVRAVRIGALLAGLAVAAWLVWRVGLETLVAQLSGLGWGLGLIMLPHVIVSVLDAAGWRYAFPGRLPALGPLIAIRLAGEAVNGTTPTGSMGGDAVKVWLVGRVGAGVRLGESLVSVVVAKTTLLGAQVAFLALGFVVAWQLIGIPRAVTVFLGVLTGLGVLAVGGFLWAQQHGLFQAATRVLAALGAGSRTTGVTRRLEGRLRVYYRGRRRRVLASGALHLLGWVAGAVEVWVALTLLGSPVAFTTALVIEAGITGVRSASFLVPASIGVQEGSVVALFVALGLGASLGLTFAIVRRIREALWVVAGYVCLAAWPGERPAALPREA